MRQVLGARLMCCSPQLLRGVPASSRSGADAVPPHHGSLRLATDSRAAVLSDEPCLELRRVDPSGSHSPKTMTGREDGSSTEHS
ncbi:hypothetical protein cypCar_00035460 [Cyprinus carpio]|nr:hypothetical protein cypCar_00035460 [Cyprinus carpio]